MFAMTLAILALAPSADVKLEELSLTVGKETRESLIAKPTKESKAVPLVFVYHGHGGTSKHAARTMDIHKHWPEALCVYPQGLPTPGQITDPEGKKTGWQMAAGKKDDRDLKFFDDLLAKLKKDYAIDDKRIYCTGHSNGGGFTYVLLDQRPDVFAAVAPSAAAMMQVKSFKPLPCLHVMGEADPLVRPEMQKRTTDVVKKTNGCDADGTSWAKSGPLTGTVFASKGGTPLVMLTHPGDHKFPAEAPELIVKFFKEHAKK